MSFISRSFLVLGRPDWSGHDRTRKPGRGGKLVLFGIAYYASAMQYMQKA